MRYPHGARGEGKGVCVCVCICVSGALVDREIRIDLLQGQKEVWGEGVRLLRHFLFSEVFCVPAFVFALIYGVICPHFGNEEEEGDRCAKGGWNRHNFAPKGGVVPVDGIYLSPRLIATNIDVDIERDLL